MNWLDLLLSQTQDLESPKRYFYFAGLATLSAVAGRKIYLDRGGAYTLYPNLFVMIVGPSGIKKGLPVKIAEKLVTEVNKTTKVTRVIAGRSSIEAIIDILGHTEMDAQQNYVKSASGFIVSGEFSQSILENPQAMTILTDLYDSQWKDEHTNLLKSGKAVLKEVYLTMLGASNETHLHAVIGQRDIMGGFVARTLFVNETKRGKKNSLVYQQENVLNYPELLEHLRIIAGLKGQFQYTPEAAEFYDDWYQKYDDDDDKTGTSNRIGDTILKVAMLLSLARGIDLLLTVEDLQTSIEVCMSCMRNAQSVTMNAPDHSSKNAQPKQAITVVKALLVAEDYTLTRQKILSKYWNVLDQFELTKAAETLKQAGAIDIVSVEGKVAYKLKDEVVAHYLNAKSKT